MGRQVPGSPRRRRVENPSRREGHACPSPGTPAALSGLGRPHPQDRYLVDARPAVRDTARGPPRGAARPRDWLPRPRVLPPGARRAGGGTSGTRASRGLERPRSAAGGAGPRASRQQPPPSEATDAAAGAEPRPRPARESGPAPARAAACPRKGAEWAGPGGSRCGARPIASLQPGGQAPRPRRRE